MNHVALHAKNKPKDADFFLKCLHAKKLKTFDLTAELCYKIFNINEPVEIIVYELGTIRFELFYTHQNISKGFTHICLNVPNKEEFIHVCTKEGLHPFTVEKDGKSILFVRDFSDNLYEIKEKL